MNRIEAVNAFLSEKNLSGSERSLITIPIVFHVVWNRPGENISDAAILEQLDILNMNYGGKNSDLSLVPSEFESTVSREGIAFCLGRRINSGKTEIGITRTYTSFEDFGLKKDLYSSEMGGQDAWDTDKYLNVWISNTGEFLTGFGTYPNQVEADRQGVVIHPRFFGKNDSQSYGLGRVAVHEVGHYLGLNHLWDDNQNCTVDDGVEDTPAQSQFYSGCPSYPQFSCNSSDMFMNFMDYVDDECMLFFTKLQMARMCMTIKELRPGLLEGDFMCKEEFPAAVEQIFSVYPNPSGGQCCLRFNEPINHMVDIQIFSAQGIKQFETQRLVHREVILSLDQLENGFYFVKVDNHVEKIFLSKGF